MEFCPVAPFPDPPPLSSSTAPDTACGRFFGCDDLVYRLFTDPQNWDYRLSHHRTGFRAMQVNKAFFYYTTPLVWDQINSFKPFYHVLQQVDFRGATYALSRASSSANTNISLAGHWTRQPK